MSTPLREARQAIGKTIHEVAEAVGVSKPSMSRIECGKQRPSPTLAEKLSIYFKGKVTETQILYPERFVDSRKKRAQRVAS